MSAAGGQPNNCERRRITATPFQPTMTAAEQSTLSLNCWIYGDGDATMFTVKVICSDNVSLLKGAIWNARKVRLAAFDADDLNVYAVAISLDIDGGVDAEEATKAADASLPLKGGLPLQRVDLFKSLDPEYLHIVVRTPLSMSSP